MNDIIIITFIVVDTTYMYSLSGNAINEEGLDYIGKSLANNVGLHTLS